MIREVDRTNPRKFKSPEGHEVTIYQDGYVKFSKDLTDDDKKIIYEASRMAVDTLAMDPRRPAEVFKQMGWKETK